MSQYLASAYYYGTNYNVAGLRTSALTTILNTQTTFDVNNITLAPDPQPGTGKYLFINAQNGQTLSYAENTSGILVSTVTAFLIANALIPPAPPCFLEGTLILTDKGYRPIETLRKGDWVKTIRHDFLAIDMIGKKRVEHPANKGQRVKEQLYQCSTAQYPEMVEDLVITGCHSILVDDFKNGVEKEKTRRLLGDIYVTDKKYRLPACVDERAVVYEKPGNYMIYHLALENEDYYMNYGIYANGLLVESCSIDYLKNLSAMDLIQ